MAESVSSLQSLQADPERLRDDHEPCTALNQIDLLFGGPTPGTEKKWKSYTQNKNFVCLHFTKRTVTICIGRAKNLTSMQKKPA